MGAGQRAQRPSYQPKALKTAGQKLTASWRANIGGCYCFPICLAGSSGYRWLARCFCAARGELLRAVAGISLAASQQQLQRLSVARPGGPGRLRRRPTGSAASRLPTACHPLISKGRSDRVGTAPILAFQKFLGPGAHLTSIVGDYAKAGEGGA